jgi:uncharacterized protein
MHELLKRTAEQLLKERLAVFPAVALLGPRQSGKSTLARMILQPMGEKALYLDLERPSDLRKLTDPETYLAHHRNQLICLDEIQRRQDLFQVLRGIIDASDTSGRFLILGSASPELLRQGSETLAGRLAFVELCPFQLGEVYDARRLWARGGFPRSYLAATDEESFMWRLDFIQTFLERDVPQMGLRLLAGIVRRLWQMLAHSQGQVLNSSKLGASLGLSHTTIRSYIDLLAAVFLVRVLAPWSGNLKKRLVRSPKVYVRDSGILHALLELDSFDSIFGHPSYGHSFEGMVLENVLSALRPGWRASFFRTARGDEIDLVLEKGARRVAIECKASAAPELERGFWRAREEISIEQTLVVAIVEETYPIGKDILVVPPSEAVMKSALGFPPIENKG